VGKGSLSKAPPSSLFATCLGLSRPGQPLLCNTSCDTRFWALDLVSLLERDVAALAEDHVVE